MRDVGRKEVASIRSNGDFVRVKTKRRNALFPFLVAGCAIRAGECNPVDCHVRWNLQAPAAILATSMGLLIAFLLKNCVAVKQYRERNCKTHECVCVLTFVTFTGW